MYKQETEYTNCAAPICYSAATNTTTIVALYSMSFFSGTGGSPNTDQKEPVQTAGLCWCWSDICYRSGTLRGNPPSPNIKALKDHMPLTYTHFNNRFHVALLYH